MSHASGGGECSRGQREFITLTQEKRGEKLLPGHILLVEEHGPHIRLLAMLPVASPPNGAREPDTHRLSITAHEIGLLL
jgi:hypothetical protein